MKSLLCADTITCESPLPITAQPLPIWWPIRIAVASGELEEAIGAVSVCGLNANSQAPRAGRRGKRTTIRSVEEVIPAGAVGYAVVGVRAREGVVVVPEP